ncbi:macrolide export protein MacA [Ruminiclostridium hungatei]|uniref:Macrolide export protein MacA n=1 Tax=Ruminiclostridium hungatei TaxID=48256 RepID=A0A1V4SKV4_RUMHU|nr:HlyD family efflux transporter periplasmic adaptor subunit [Ruminiclostridium hungatei]OPX44444.1 macrolide export protein MacA [Ruminiclostridium hungatei]
MQPKRKSAAWKWVTLIIIIFLAAVAAILFNRGRDLKDYRNIKAQEGDITTYHSFSGNIEAKHRQAVTSETVMQISDILVKEGDLVKKGDVLAETSSGQELSAEIDGEVASISVEEDVMVMAGVRLMEIVDYNNLEIKVRVDEYDLGYLKKGMAAQVKIGALNKELTGKISSISKEGVVANGLTYFIAAIDLNRDQTLKVGMSAEVRLVKASAKGVVTIPMYAVSFDADNAPYVLKENPNGRGSPVRADIVTGINNGTEVEVKNGVSSGETILYTGTGTGSTAGMGFRGRQDSSTTLGGAG